MAIIFIFFLLVLVQPISASVHQTNQVSSKETSAQITMSVGVSREVFERALDYYTQCKTCPDREIHIHNLKQRLELIDPLK